MTEMRNLIIFILKSCICHFFFVILRAKLQINEQYNNCHIAFIAQLGGTERVDARHLEP